jgi:uncharacterized protein YraI
MTSYPIRAVFQLSLVFAVVLSILASPLLTGLAQAQSSLAPGATAFVANTGGEPALLRETPSFDAAVISSFPEGTPADVVEGPVYDADGVPWLGVSIGGVSGYIVAGYLSGGDQADQAAADSVELAQEAAPADAAPADESIDAPAPAEAAPEPAASLDDVPANPVATADLNLRAGPSYDDMVLQVIPAGTPLTTTGDWSQGFVGVDFSGQYGWVDSSWLGSGDAAPQDVTLQQDAAPDATYFSAPVDTSGVITDPAAAPAGDTVSVAGVTNLRAGPAATDPVLRVLPPGAAVTVTGASSDGWTPVWYNGTWGFVSADLLGGASPAELAQTAAPAPSSEAAPATDSGTLSGTTLSDVNLRADPDPAAMVLDAIPAGVALAPISGPQQGFYQVQYDGQTGWVAADYLQVSADQLQRDKSQQDSNPSGKVTGSEPASNVDPGAGGVMWPVHGGLWYVLQGYNGSSHQNQDGLWQYYYSLDIARRDGNTAGQEVVSPVNGVVRWTDPSSGGISIDIGNGHAVAMFHCTFMNGLQAGTTVQQGQHLGVISGPGGPGWAGIAHLHFTLWGTNDDGNWDRHAEPFTGQYSISGMDFPDIGGSSEYEGTEFSP